MSCVNLQKVKVEFKHSLEKGLRSFRYICSSASPSTLIYVADKTKFSI